MMEYRKLYHLRMEKNAHKAAQRSAPRPVSSKFIGWHHAQSRGKITRSPYAAPPSLFGLGVKMMEESSAIQEKTGWRFCPKR